jgi:hypothetical protein
LEYGVDVLPLPVLKPGTQVIYVPNHITSEKVRDLLNFDYPNGTQPGFVISGPTSVGNYFVRYWKLEGKIALNHLRTIHNSELTMAGNILVRSSVPQGWVVDAMKFIESLKDEK